MQFISSDANVWLDYAVINRLELPFKLPYVYLMDEEAIDNELLQPCHKAALQLVYYPSKDMSSLSIRIFLLDFGL